MYDKTKLKAKSVGFYILKVRMIVKNVFLYLKKLGEKGIHRFIIRYLPEYSNGQNNWFVEHLKLKNIA